MDIIDRQLEMLSDVIISNTEDNIIFKKDDGTVKLEVIVEFEDYVVNPPEWFTFNKKFNNGVNPPQHIMHGDVVKETEKMFYFRLRSGTDLWEGWCPKKSCKVR